MAPFLDERGRRLFTASEARAAGRGGITAVATATRVARSTIGRGLAELRLGRDDLRTGRAFMRNSRDVIPTIAAGYSGDQQPSWFGVRRRSLELLGIG